MSAQVMAIMDGEGTGAGVTLQSTAVETAAATMRTPAPVSEKARRRIEDGRNRQSELARELGFSPSHVCLIFSGKRVPSLPVAAAMASKLKVTIDELYVYLIEPTSLEGVN